MSYKFEYFVSHASKDAAIVKAFCNFIQLAANVQKQRIFCTCLPDNGLRNNEYFFPAIRDNIASSKNIIFLISWNFLDSQDCLMELGMAHMLPNNDKNIICLLVGDVSFDDMPKMLAGIQQVGRIQEAQSLLKLKKILYPNEKESDMPSSSWVEHQNSFLTQTSTLVSTISKSRQYSALEYEQLEARLASTKRELESKASAYTEVHQQLILAQEKNSELIKRFKKRDEIPDELCIESRCNSADRFEELKDAAKSALKNLPGIVQDIIYYEMFSYSRRFISDGYWSTNDFMSAVNSGYLDEDAPYLREENLKIKRALGALENLENFLSNESGNLIESLTEDSNTDVSLKNKEFWDYLFC